MLGETKPKVVTGHFASFESQKSVELSSVFMEMIRDDLDLEGTVAVGICSG